MIPVRALRVVVLLVCVGAVAGPRAARAQLTSSDEERLQILSDPEALKSKLEKEKTRAAFEFFRSQVAPLDVLPLVKPYHWNTVTLDARANHEDYEGSLQFFPILLPGMPQEVVFVREARLVKEQRTSLRMQVMLPRIPKELNVELLRPGAIRFDELWQVPFRVLPPSQMLVVVLSKDPATQYASWNRLPCVVPSSSDREDPMALDLQRYYRMVLPEDPDKPFLSPHPLTWASISHIIWDSLPPDSLSVSHQQALLDWLHWGGQLVLIGGAGPTFSIFRESFLGPYLPAEPTGENKLLGEAELKPLAASYRPTLQPGNPGEPASPALRRQAAYFQPFGSRYGKPVPIEPPRNRPVFVAGLRARPGAATIPLGEGSPHLLAVESRVGRGRITMLTINPNEPTLATWPGLDTLVRRVVFRRPEEAAGTLAMDDATGTRRPVRPSLDGPDLSWYRITSRDAGAEAEHVRLIAQQAAKAASASPSAPNPQAIPTPSFGSPAPLGVEAEEAALNHAGVAEWRDTTSLPRLSRDLLEKASGISVPSSQFVLKVILAYVLAVVPLNLLICRLILRRREWSWIVVPLLALAFAIGVERVAAYDMGYDSACDEIDLLELHGGFPRAHLSRFASLYTTGRAKYAIAYPNDPTALALPFNNERSIGGEDVTTAAWQSYPVPTLQSFAVQPRSLAMYRAEQMIGLSGAIKLEAGSRRTLVNGTDLELRDAVLIDFTGTGDRRESYLGTIAPGQTVDLDAAPGGKLPAMGEGFDGPDPAPFLDQLRRIWEGRAENSGELRLVAWIPQAVEGQVFDPILDRHRGITAVLVHLRYGNPPSPDGPRYNQLAAGEAEIRVLEAVPPPRPRRARGAMVKSPQGG
jgi:hypothetical protein